MLELVKKDFRREHDCEFLIYDETLNQTYKLRPRRSRTNITSWPCALVQKIKKECAYIVSLDPSLGTGGDYGAIQVFELPTMTQVAEWQHNNTPIQGQIRIMKQMIDQINEDLKSIRS